FMARYKRARVAVAANRLLSLLDRVETQIGAFFARFVVGTLAGIFVDAISRRVTLRFDFQIRARGFEIEVVMCVRSANDLFFDETTSDRELLLVVDQALPEPNRC